METATLDDFMCMNDQLAALIEAGVPLDIDLGRDKVEAAAKLAFVRVAMKMPVQTRMIGRRVSV